MTDKETRIDDCWNRIGTWGEDGPTCERLRDVHHCLNCDVYAAAGRALLERAPPPGYLDDWKTFLAQPTVRSSGAMQSIVIFRLDRYWLGLSTSLFENIVEPRTVHSLPHNRNQAVLGLVSVRGELVVCISLGHLVSESPADFTRRMSGAFPRDIVVERDDNRWAFPVSEVHGVVRVPRENYAGVSTYHGGLRREFLAGVLPWRNTQVACLDDAALIKSLTELRLA